LRKGRELYSEMYEKAMELHVKGKPIKEIASELGISYSACYHWVKGLRKPERGNMNSFVEEVQKKGPIPAMEIKEKFPKHNELFLSASRRGMQVKRYILPRRIGEYRTWYFAPGQEEKLKRNVIKLVDKYKELKAQLLGNFKL
jgi:hypothetical protein